MSKSTEIKCPKCGDENIVRERRMFGAIYCGNCGHDCKTHVREIESNGTGERVPNE